MNGKLTVYLGYAIGVGKTYQMLIDAHKLVADGVDLVIGYLEPHERADTVKKMDGLEIVPRKQIPYRTIILQETDIEAVVDRHPAVALVDEMAHTNVPGSAYIKRCQDIEILLAHGIDVMTTLNAQHLESFAPHVEKTIGIRVSERIPDHVVARADRIVTIDIPVPDLLRRAKNGKVFRSDMLDIALHNFFTAPNLHYLRKYMLYWQKQEYVVSS